MEVIPGDAVPEPYRALLVHERDMTSTLERFHGSEIYIKAQGAEQRDGKYFREVVLHLANNDVPVEFGANCVNLHLFTPEARWMILQRKFPWAASSRTTRSRTRSACPAFSALNRMRSSTAH